MAQKILIVDDDPVQRRLLDAAVTRLGYDPVAVDGGTAALDALRARQGFSAMILDLVMPDLDGFGVLETARAEDVLVPTIVQTSQGGIETVVNAMRAGAVDFAVKPVSAERLSVSLQNAMKVEALEDAVVQLKKTAAGTFSFDDIITRSKAMERVLELCRRAAGSSIPVLIEGESGVGKELIARAVQGSGARRSKPFVTVNCGAIPENLVESILFGHEKGAFTGATEKHIGKFQEANRGTLFLDEVGELPPDIQVKLLRVLQEGEVDPVGARTPRKVDVRVISATNRDLMDEVRNGSFREDLYYRLNVFPISVPPLRERTEDIPALVRHFITRIAAEEGRKGLHGATPDAIDLLMSYDWPGNIRQLENAVFRAVVLSEGSQVTAQEFPQITGNREPAGEGGELAAASSGEAAGAGSLYGFMRFMDGDGHMRPMAELETEIVTRAIEHYDGRMSEVARRLEIGRSTLYRKLKEIGYDSDRDAAE